MEETMEEARERRQQRTLERLATVVQVLAMERHSLRSKDKEADARCCYYDFEGCSDDVCSDAFLAAQEAE